MTKVTLGLKPLLYPMPTLLVGANVHDKPNFMAVAWGGIACSDPPMISIGIRPRRYTFLGIRQNLAFSVNIPSTDMIKETDYCGIASGRNVDKVVDFGQCGHLTNLRYDTYNSISIEPSTIWR